MNLTSDLSSEEGQNKCFHRYVPFLIIRVHCVWLRNFIWKIQSTSSKQVWWKKKKKKIITLDFTTPLMTETSKSGRMQWPSKTVDWKTFPPTFEDSRMLATTVGKHYMLNNTFTNYPVRNINLSSKTKLILQPRSNECKSEYFIWHIYSLAKHSQVQSLSARQLIVRLDSTPSLGFRGLLTLGEDGLGGISIDCCCTLPYRTHQPSY